MLNSGKLEINNIEELIKVRQIIAAAKGNIGLFWLNKEMSKVLVSNVNTVQDIVGGMNELPKFISTQKTHEDAYKEFAAEQIIQAGGNPNLYRLLPRGFVAFDIKNDKFIIVGGDWLNETTKKIIADAFEINIADTVLFPNSDYNFQSAK